MNTNKKYKYILRKGYESEDLLIHFNHIYGGKTFGRDLFEAIKEINPSVIEKEDVWINSEMLYKINTNIGKFELSSDAWDSAFIHSSDSSIILKINELLLKDYRFDKVESFVN